MLLNYEIVKNKCLIVYFPCGAGGKFIINLLGLSRHCSLHSFNLAQWDSKQTVFDDTYYQTKLNYILKTVPNEKQSANWQQYEMGNALILDFTNPNFYTYANKILQRDQHFCIIAHNANELDRCVNIIGSDNIIKITNFTNWLGISAFKLENLRNDLENKQKHHQCIDAQELQDQPTRYKFLIDIDNTINDPMAFLNQIKNIYNVLGWDDFNLSAASTYYYRYLESHNLLSLI